MKSREWKPEILEVPASRFPQGSVLTLPWSQELIKPPLCSNKIELGSITWNKKSSRRYMQHSDGKRDWAWSGSWRALPFGKTLKRPFGKENICPEEQWGWVEKSRGPGEILGGHFGDLGIGLYRGGTKLGILVLKLSWTWLCSHGTWRYLNENYQNTGWWV